MPCQRLCRSGFRQSRSRAGQGHRKRCKLPFHLWLRYKPCQRLCRCGLCRTRSKARQWHHSEHSSGLHRRRRKRHHSPCRCRHCSRDRPKHHRIPHPTRKRLVHTRRPHPSKRCRMRCTAGCPPWSRSNLPGRKPNPHSKPDPRHHRRQVARRCWRERPRPEHPPPEHPRPKHPWPRRQ